MKKSKLNLIIDVLLLLCFAAIVGIGLLIKYVLARLSTLGDLRSKCKSVFLWSG